MDSFDQFMSMVPNLSTPATSFNGQQPDNAYPNKGFQEIDPPNGASDTLTAVERRQHKNKVAQKRFRERQKVCPVTPADCTPSQNVSTQLYRVAGTLS